MLNTVVMVARDGIPGNGSRSSSSAFFTARAERPKSARTFLRTISWTFIAQGVVFTCSGMFQGLGNTDPRW